MTKITYRLPTVDYAFIEVQEEAERTPTEIVERFKELQQAYNGGFGLETKEWNQILDIYLLKESMPSNKFDELSKEQAFVIHEIDKAKARIKSKKQ